MLKINLTKGVDKYLFEKARSNPRDNAHFHPSSWDDCKRKIAYQYYESQGYITIADEALKINSQLERIFDNGHSVHARWQEYLFHAAPGALCGKWRCSFTKCGVLYGSESKLGIPKPPECTVCGNKNLIYEEVGFSDEETMWSGHVDAIVNVKKWNEYLVGEFSGEDEFIAVGVFSHLSDEDSLAICDYKSMNPFDFKKLEQPKSDHITQIQIYMYLSGLKCSKFIYEDKSNQAVKEFLVERDDNLLRVKVEEAKRLKHIVLHTNSSGKRVLPERGYAAKSHKKCLQCKYRGHCWK